MHWVVRRLWRYKRIEATTMKIFADADTKTNTRGVAEDGKRMYNPSPTPSAYSKPSIFHQLAFPLPLARLVVLFDFDR